MKRDTPNLTPEQMAELAALKALPDDKIDTRDVPEVKDWSGAVRGAFYRPVKKQLTLRLDADVVEWFRRQTPNGEGYYTSSNQALRYYVIAQLSRKWALEYRPH